MKKNRGIALVSILIIAAALLAIISAGLKLGGDGVLFASLAHQRNVAIGAAEAGVHEAMIRLQTDRGFAGVVTETLTESGASYRIEVENDLAASGVAKVVSTGTFGGQNRTLRVELEPDSSEFDAVSVGGQVYIYEHVYTNGISSATQRLVRPGGMHSRFASDTAYSGMDYKQGRTIYPRLHTTGNLTTASSTLKDGLSTTTLGERTRETKVPYELNKAKMLQGSFTTVSTVSGMPSVITGNTRYVGTKARFTGPITVNKGATLHIENQYAEFIGGLRGEGQVVVDKDVVVRVDSTLDPEVDGGLQLYAESALLVHQDVGTDGDGLTVPRDSDAEVGDYFAQMPMQAARELPTGVPLDAPQGAAFFRWFHDRRSVGNPGQEFNLWFDGNGTELHPGLSTPTKDWLKSSSGLVPKIEAWAAD